MDSSTVLCRLIAPQWLIDSQPELQRTVEGLFTRPQLKEYNALGYNIYWLPNHPKEYQGGHVSGADVDIFEYVFVDFDLKSGPYESKDAFIEAVAEICPLPSILIDSGNGMHAYWRVSDLDAISYLRISRRFLRILRTDPAVGKIVQLMRLPDTFNTKVKDQYKWCTIEHQSDVSYTCEELDNVLPPITAEDEEFCQRHYNQTYNPNVQTEVSYDLPPKFGKLLYDNHEAKSIWAGDSDDRSRDDYRLGHIMFASDFSKEEAISVLVNSAKAMSRAPIHRINYAQNIVDKIWTYEKQDKDLVNLSPTVRDILSKGEEVLKGTRFPCNKLIDDTQHGFRLGQVIGIIGGSGVGKTTLVLNAFLWFVKHNPDYHHFFFSLEQPSGEIANRIKTICQGNDSTYDKIHIVSNYLDDGTFKHFSMKSIEEHILEYQNSTGNKVGTVVVDHIGVLDKETRNGENEGLIGICKEMKSFAVRLNVMLIMLSQAPREKAGIGDLELDKSAAYGTVFFESFLDYCICLWQPLKRVYTNGAPTIMAIKFAKIRHKSQNKDRIKEDVCYQFFFDPETEQLRELTQQEESTAAFYQQQAINARKLDKRNDLVSYKSMRIEESKPTQEKHGKKVQ